MNLSGHAATEAMRTEDRSRRFLRMVTKTIAIANCTCLQRDGHAEWARVLDKCQDGRPSTGQIYRVLRFS